jgi:histone acetyltransferase (RNA polymerase elongator complex component)
MRKYNLPIFIPHRGCPHDCAFCSQRKITGVETEVTPGDVKALIKSFLATIDAKNASTEVAFFGGSFTGLELSTQEIFLKAAAEFYPNISGIRLSTRPDYINKEILDLLKKYGVSTIELGVQSSSNNVLELNDRGHTFEDVIRASELIKSYGISLGHQIMLGMYGSDAEFDMKTVDDILFLQPLCVRIYPVVILKGTKLEKYYNSGKYKPYTVEEAAELAKKAVLKFNDCGVQVIRLGLHSSDELNDDETIIAGPYHPAFGEIVESLIYRDKIESILSKENMICNEYDFYCNPKDISKAVGHKKMNKLYFKKKYGIDLNVYGSSIKGEIV